MKSLFLLIAFVAVASTKFCRDSFRDCYRRKQICKSTLRRFCAQTCGLCGCRDSDPRCAYRKNFESCRSIYMKRSCAKTCGLCGNPTPPPSCRDSDSRCYSRKRFESCRSTSMQRSCAKTCGLCGDRSTFAPPPTGVPPTPPKGCMDSDSRCYYRKRFESCRSTSMQRSCAKTCGLCGDRSTFAPPTGVPPTPPKGQCGKVMVQGSRVIAGQTAREGAWPWQILLKNNGRAGCGGSLISPKWVVTAAHCIRFGSYSVVVGEHDRNKRTGHEKEIRATRAFTHPKWNRRSFIYDVALVELSEPAQLSNYVYPVCLPETAISVGASCYITGWGKTSSGGQMTNRLQQASMRVVDQKLCQRKNHAAIGINVHDSMICGEGSGRVSGCQGDSGGPFVCNRNGRYELHGAVSHGSRYCRSSETYTVFSRISHVRDWIRQNTGV